jgi:hypothetical protein
MKRTISFFLFISLVMVWVAGCTPAATAVPTPTPLPPTATPIPATPTPSAQDAINKLHWFGTATFLYHGSQNIYFDPIALAGNLPPADLILITHAHTDHWSVADIQKVAGPNTTLIISPGMSKAYETNKAEIGIPATVLAEGQTIEVKGVSVQAVPAYGGFHPREDGGVGYIVTIDGVRLYHAGGTDAYPEMAQNTCDVAMIPAYTRPLAQAMAEIIPAKAIIIEHTLSYYVANALAILFTRDIGGEKMFVALESGPYNP